MTSFGRAWLAGAVTCGAVLVPAAGALAGHMPGMAPGVACPHGSGEGPNALEAAPPGEGGPQRESSDAPLGSAGQSAPVASAPAAGSAPASQGSRPATRVSQPVTQVQTQRPVTTVAQSQPSAAVAEADVPRTTTVPVRSAVAAPSRSGQPRARRVAQRQRAERPAPGRARFNGMEPRVAKQSAAVDEVTVAGARANAAERGLLTPLTSVLGLLALAGVAAAALLARRRRGGSGVEAAELPSAPAAPSFADASLEAELYEMISEARARTLLAPAEPRADERLAKAEDR